MGSRKTDGGKPGNVGAPSADEPVRPWTKEEMGAAVPISLPDPDDATDTHVTVILNPGPGQAEAGGLPD